MWIFRLEGRLGNYDGDGNEKAKNRSEKNFVFSFYDIRKKFRTRTRILFGLERGSTCTETPMSFRYRVNKYREIHGDGTNSLQNESHAGIMWIASPLYWGTEQQSLHLLTIFGKFLSVRTCNRGSKHMANNFTSSLLNVEIGKTLTRREFSQ